MPAEAESKRQRVSDSVARGGKYHRGLRLDGSRCLAALDNPAMHSGAARLGPAHGPPKQQHLAAVPNGIATAAAQQTLAGLVLELVDDGGADEQGPHAAARTGASARRDSMRWVATLQSAHLAELDPRSETLNRTVRRVPGGVALEYSMAAGATRASASLDARSRRTWWKLGVLDSLTERMDAACGSCNGKGCVQVTLF